MAVVFDLDGTISDSDDDVRFAINSVLRAHGEREITRSESLSLAGGGLRASFRGALALAGAEESGIERMCAEMMECYAGHCVSLTRSYEGVHELLLALRARGERLGVISNKTLDLVRVVLSFLYGDVSFDFVIGEGSGFPPKPDGSALASIREKLGEGERLFYVGDTEIDWRMAKDIASGVAIVLWGYRGREALLARQVPESVMVENVGQLSAVLQIH